MGASRAVAPTDELVEQVELARTEALDGVLAVAVGVLMYTLWSGFRASVLTDFAQVIAMLGAVAVIIPVVFFAAGALLRYVSELQPAGLPHLQRPEIRRGDALCWVDEMTRRNLELTETLRPDLDRDDERPATLLGVIDNGLDIVRNVSDQWGVKEDHDCVTVWADVRRRTLDTIKALNERINGDPFGAAAERAARGNSWR